MGPRLVEDDAPRILSRKGRREEAELAFGLLLQMSSGREGRERELLYWLQSPVYPIARNA